jgi:formylglycine-generating enzyme required for sulfatase activity
LNFPAERVSWDDAVEFCKKLSAKEGETYRLPTEAEWEYACRAGSTTWYSFGDEESRLGQYAWFGESEGETHPVGTKKPNAWGLYDMHGNVVECCSDWYGTYGTSPTDDPTGPATSSGRVFRRGWPDTVWLRVFRGGRFDSAAGDCQSSYRNGGDPSNRNDSLGFRVTRNLSSE